MLMYRVIIADSDESYRHSIWMILRDRYQVSLVSGELDAILALEAGSVDLLIYGAPGIGEGTIQFLRRVQETRRGLPILFLPEVIRYREIDEEVVDFVTDVLQKPFTPFQLIKAVSGLLDKVKARASLRPGRGVGEVDRVYQRLIETKRFSERTRAAALRCSGHNAPVLIEGEVGTGKMLLARAIHHLGGKKGPFIRVDCRSAQADVIARAHDEGGEDGTLYFYAVEAMSGALQQTCIESLEEGMVKSGKKGARALTMRIISATTGDLGERVIQGEFNEILYQILRAGHVHLEPLRVRAADMDKIVYEIVHELASRHGLEAKPFQSDVIRTLVKYYWPGNITELQAVVARALANSTGPAVMSADIEFGFSVVAEKEARPASPAGVGIDRPSEGAPRPPESGPSPAAAHLESLLAEIASSVKNPLVSLKTFVQLLDEKFDDSEFRDSFYRTVSSDVDRIDSLMDRLLYYVRSVEGAGGEMEVGPEIEALVTATMEKLEGGREITLDLTQELAEVRLESAGLKFAISGLLEDAIQASPEGSMIRLTASRREIKGIDMVFVQFAYRLIPERAMGGRVEEGLDLKLATWLAERMGGRIRIEPVRDQEASITIQWPIEREVMSG